MAKTGWVTLVRPLQGFNFRAGIYCIVDEYDNGDIEFYNDKKELCRTNYKTPYFDKYFDFFTDDTENFYTNKTESGIEAGMTVSAKEPFSNGKEVMEVVKTYVDGEGEAIAILDNYERFYCDDLSRAYFYPTDKVEDSTPRIDRILQEIQSEIEYSHNKLDKLLKTKELLEEARDL